jgi:hypothetical protein
VAVPFVVGSIPYAFRREPVAILRAVGSVCRGERQFAEGWNDWANKTSFVRAFLGPWVMGHASDAGLAAATAAFVDAIQDVSTRRTRLIWQGLAMALLVGLECAQAPLGFGTFDPQDTLVLAVSAIVVVAACERSRARRAKA